MRKKLNISLQKKKKKQLNTKVRNAENEGQKKAVRHVEKKEHYDRRKSLLISKCFKY